MLDEEFQSLVKTDTYLVARKKPTDVECQLYLKEVDFCCPLCGKILRHRQQKKSNRYMKLLIYFLIVQQKSNMKFYMV